MKIAIGSTNPVKVNAAKRALRSVYPNAKFLGIAVDSGVPAQPMGDRQTIRGAIGRAKRALKQTGADLAVGLEGGLIRTRYGLMSSAWCALVDPTGKVGLGGGMHFHMPDRVAHGINQGRELGDVMDELTGEKDIKKKMGAVGVLTKGLLNRTQEYAHLVKLALVKFRSPEWFE
jgi:inosine/xanthosine triphosphatase